MILGACATEPGPLPEDVAIPGDTLVEKLSRISQLDLLDDTVADHARCSTAASLSAYLLLGGDFASLARRFGIPPEFTFANVHRLQEALYHHADRDGEPGIFGSAIPTFDARGNYTGWRLQPEDEFHRVVEALGLRMDRVYGPTEDDPEDRRAAVERWLAHPDGVVFIVGVDEDAENERFVPMQEVGNHYIAIFPHGDGFLALDSYRRPGRSTLVPLSTEQAEAHLFHTPNAICALSPR